MLASRTVRFTGLLASLIVVLSMVSVDQAEARRGGSFGSRGGRTFAPPAATQTAPAPVSPVQRTMTPNQQPGTAASAPTAQQRGGLFGGLGGGLMRGLMLGGLLGLLFGAGFGGVGGILAMLVQIALIGGVIWLAMRFFRSRSPQTASAAGPDMGSFSTDRRGTRDTTPDYGFGGSAHRPAANSADPNELGIGLEDLEKFEGMLTRVQAAFAAENYAALRVLTTPEVMGYLSEELATNATNGVKNDVTDVKLLQGDLAESWREGGEEFATVAMRYSSIDVTRERSTGKVVEGDPDQPSEATEIWTFKRPRGGDWLLSAIQEA